MQNKFLVLILMIMFSSCEKNDKKEPEKSGQVSFYFNHFVNDQQLLFDTLKYQNAAGNQFLVNEIQYFISDVILYKNDGSALLLDAFNDIHYIDTDLPETWNYTFQDKIPVGTYDSISFTFGITEEKNITLMFVNPPESNMFWPEYLGGGYHYMKLNGKWKNTQGTMMPFNFHLGIGQIYDPVSNEITGFVQNYFRVHLNNSGFAISENEMVYFDLIMNVDEWFQSPNTYDFNYWGGDIMQNQPAMEAVKQNGNNVFSISRMITD